MKYQNTTSFSQFCEGLGAKRKNQQWSWCAHNPARKLALFTIWENEILDGGSYVWERPPNKQSHGRNEIWQVLQAVLEEAHDAYGIMIERGTRKDGKVYIKSFNQTSLAVLDFASEDDRVIAYLKGSVPGGAVRDRLSPADAMAVSAADDITSQGLGNDDPEYRSRMSGSYVRDGKVRELVLKRAKGVCEECGQPGFLKLGGERYLETHHVISLSEQGPDRPHNVIALCATDHRRAHYAENWVQLQDKFLAKLSKYKTEN